MTYEECLHFLSALAGKHLRHAPLPSPPPPSAQYFDQVADLRRALDRVSGTSRLLKVVRDRDDPILLNRLVDDLQDSPVRRAVEQMEAAGILDALDAAPDLVLGELRRSAIPMEDEEFLRSAGFDAHNIEVLLALAVHRARALAVKRQVAVGDRTSALARFGAFYLGRLWDVYARRLLSSGPL